MTAKYPPRSRRSAEIEQLIDVYGTVVVERGAYYVSTPVTSGRRFLAWRSKSEIDESHPAYVDELWKAVAEPNCAEVQPLVRALRGQVREPVIDPTALPNLPGWSQDDFRAFWAAVIERYVGTIIFVDGWAHSSGCSYEFLVAKRSGRQCLNVNREELTVREGLSLVRLAMADYHRQRLPTGILEHIARDLECLMRDGEEGHEHGILDCDRIEVAPLGSGAAALQR